MRFITGKTFRVIDTAALIFVFLLFWGEGVTIYIRQPVEHAVHAFNNRSSLKVPEICSLDM